MVSLLCHVARHSILRHRDLRADRGHPSVEALALLWSGTLKVALAAAAILALGVALARGEKISSIVLGVICVLCESVYTLTYPNYPFLWLVFRP
jgi:hypothetical protein